MTDVFNLALDFVLAQEGGYTNDAEDPGGETNFGICKRAYPNIDIKSLTLDTAKAIYRRDYWDAAKCGDLPPAVAVMHFDCAVNQGVGAAAKFLQFAAGVKADGAIGPKTIAAVSAGDETQIVLEYAARRMSHYGRLPHFETFGLGWSRRLMKVLRLSLVTGDSKKRGSECLSIL